MRGPQFLDRNVFFEATFGPFCSMRSVFHVQTSGTGQDGRAERRPLRCLTKENRCVADCFSAYRVFNPGVPKVQPYLSRRDSHEMLRGASRGNHMREVHLTHEVRVWLLGLFHHVLGH